MGESGRVVAVREGIAEVVVERSGMCARCGACMVLETGQMRATVRNAVGAGVGDLVEVEMAQGSVLGAAAIVYLIPLVSFFVGYFLGAAASGWLGLAKEGTGIVAGMLALVLSFVGVARYDRTAREKGSYQLTITQVWRGEADAT